MRTDKKEEYAVVLDFLPHGYPFDNTPSYKKDPIAQVMGKDNFTLLEIVPKKGVHMKPHDELYIGDGKREEVHHIVGKLLMSKLTGTAKSEIPFIIEEIVNKNEKKFVDFFNNAGPLTTRMHQTELLPGVGKKHMWGIIEERRGDEFKSFDDIKNRVKLISEPKKLIIKRILKEMEGKEKHNLFVDV